MIPSTLLPFVFPSQSFDFHPLPQGPRADEYVLHAKMTVVIMRSASRAQLSRGERLPVIGQRGDLTIRR